MTIKEALEFLGINTSIDKLDESILRKAYHKTMKKYHPDLQHDTSYNYSAIEREEMSKKLNEAYGLLKDKINKKFDFNTYKNDLIYKLQQKFLININGVAVKLEIATIIQNLINSLNYINNLNSFNTNYDRVNKEINKLVMDFRRNLINDLNSFNIFGNNITMSIYGEHVNRMSTSYNIFSIYHIYDTGKKKMKDNVNSIKLTKEDVGNIINDFRNTYLNINVNSYENIEINKLINSLAVNYQNIDTFEFYNKLKHIKYKIEQIITKYYNDKFLDLENKYKQAFTKFPTTRNVFLSVKMHSFNVCKISQVDEVINNAKIAVNNEIKRVVKDKLDNIIDKYKDNIYLQFIEDKVNNKYQEVISSNKRLVTTNYDYEKDFTNNIDNYLSSYQDLLKKRDKLILELESLNANEKLISSLKRNLNYDEMQKLINQTKLELEKIKKANKKEKIKEIANKLRVKLNKKEQELLENLNFKSINEINNLYIQILDILDKYNKNLVEIDFNLLNQIDFNDLKKDLEVLSKACHKKEIDHELILDYLPKNSNNKKK